jgi:hypothetical protein
LECLHYGSVFVLGRLQPIHGLMLMWVERLPDWIDPLGAELGDVFEQLLVNQLKPLR